MLYDPARHEPLESLEWDDRAAVRTIERIVRDTEERFSPESHWPLHPLDAEDGKREPVFNLYFGASGVVWALHYLQAVGAVRLRHSYDEYVDTLLPLNRAWLKSQGSADVDVASFLMGDTSILLLSHWLRPNAEKAARLKELIAGNLDNPARELMWGAPGTLLAALFLHQWTREPRWAELYVATARKLWSQLLWSPEYQCGYWSQELYGHHCTCLDAVHGFVATAAPIIKGRHELDPGEWDAWEQCIVATIRSTAQREGDQANWRPYLYPPGGSTHPQKLLMQFCHGAPGFVICLADLPSKALDDDLLAGGEATWQAGPLKKGSNLCHGTGGNGYALLKLFERTGDERWLVRARSFAMHGIAQTEAHALQYGQMRYSLWTGDLGFAIYLRDCIRGAGTFPTLDAFFVQPN
jgi:Lanthionine synthetase C-like protein